MKKIALTLVTVSLALLLFGADPADSTGTNILSDMKINVCSDVGFGEIVDRNMMSLSYGIGLEYKNSYRLTGYRRHMSEVVDLFDAPKYEMHAGGVRLAFVYRTGDVKIIPSVGYEFGTMRIGEGAYEQTFLGYTYESFRNEHVHYTPLGLGLEIKAISYLSVYTNLTLSPHREYKYFEMKFGFNIGKWY